MHVFWLTASLPCSISLLTVLFYCTPSQYRWFRLFATFFVVLLQKLAEFAFLFLSQGWFFVKVTVKVTGRCRPGQVHHQFWGRKRRGGGVWCRSWPVTPPYRCQIWSLFGQWLALWHIQASAMVGVSVVCFLLHYSSVTTALSSSPHQIQPLGTGLGLSKLTWSGVVLGFRPKTQRCHFVISQNNLRGQPEGNEMATWDGCCVDSPLFVENVHNLMKSPWYDHRGLLGVKNQLSMIYLS